MIKNRWMLDGKMDGKWACGRRIAYAHPDDIPKEALDRLRSDKTEWKLVMTIETDHSKPTEKPSTRIVDKSVKVPDEVVKAMNDKIRVVEKHPQRPGASLHRILLFISK